MGTTYTLKYALDLPRPNGGGQSFPSGHASSAFAGAWFLQRRYGWKYGLPSLILAGLVGLSRIEAKKHWPIDVVGSALLSLGITFTFTNRYTLSLSKGESYLLSFKVSW